MLGERKMTLTKAFSCWLVEPGDNASNIVDRPTRQRVIIKALASASSFESTQSAAESPECGEFLLVHGISFQTSLSLKECG